MIRNLPHEIWKDVVFDDIISEREIFKISNYGRLINCKNYQGKSDYIMKDRLLNGYHTVQVRKKDNKTTARCIHKLVAEHFIERPKEAICVIHLDYDKNNNKIENLKWATKKEKEEHQFTGPIFKNRKVSKNMGSAKLTETQVMRLKRKLFDPNRKTRLRLLAKEFGVSEMQLHRIKTGENWGHIKVEVPKKKEKIPAI